MTVRALTDGPTDGPTNMARDRALLQDAEASVLSARTYAWSEVWISRGRAQREADVAEEFPGWPQVERPTGGGAVLHANDLTLSLAVPLEGLNLNSRDVKAVYRRLVAPVVEALRAVGLPARLADDEAAGYQGARDCFAGLGKSDVFDPASGRKLCGCALHVTRRAALLQASVPWGESPDWLDEVHRARYRNPEFDRAALSRAFLTAATRTA